ncbi:MAG: hypothetical protein DRQ99_14830 [Candidatus Parabeggiatoa sp. nov. 3]|nr:MAG: hypothetical protein DRQ99_14830 [Gammaproteobacteria bacterium]
MFLRTRGHEGNLNCILGKSFGTQKLLSEMVHGTIYRSLPSGKISQGQTRRSAPTRRYFVYF